MKTKPSNKGLYASIVGTGVVALCCFTPILVITVGVVGLGALTPYLDYILFPALALMILVTIMSYLKYKKGRSTCSVEDTLNNKDN